MSDVDQARDAFDRWQDEIARAGSRADALEALNPLARLLAEDRPIRVPYLAERRPLTWGVRYSSFEGWRA